MQFEYEAYRKYLKYLAPEDRAHFQKLMTPEAQAIIDDLILNPESKQNLKQHEINPAVSLDFLLISQFFDPLIDKLEESTEDEKKENFRDFDSALMTLRNERLKMLNAIRQMGEGPKLTFKDFEGRVFAPIGENGNSFTYNNYEQLKNIVQKMSEVYQKNGTIPCTFRITPHHTAYSNTSDEFKYKQIIKGVLEGAAKAGISPDQVIIEINGVEQTPEKDDAYQSYIKDAEKIIKEKLEAAYPKSSLK